MVARKERSNEIRVEDVDLRNAEREEARSEGGVSKIRSKENKECGDRSCRVEKKRRQECLRYKERRNGLVQTEGDFDGDDYWDDFAAGASRGAESPGAHLFDGFFVEPHTGTFYDGDVCGSAINGDGD